MAAERGPQCLGHLLTRALRRRAHAPGTAFAFWQQTRALLRELSSIRLHRSVVGVVVVFPCTCRAAPDGLLFRGGLQMAAVDESNGGIEMV